MLDQISLVVDFLFDTFSQIGVLYTSNPILGSVIALFVLGWLVRLIRKVMP